MSTNRNEHEAESRLPERPGWKRVLGRTVVSLVLGIVLAFLLPTRLTEEMGALKMARYAAPITGYFLDQKYNRVVSAGHGDDVTILLIDRDALNAHKQVWPANYNFYAYLLQKLKLYPPKLLFFDVILSQEHNKGYDSFKKELTALTAAQKKDKEKNTEVLFAAMRTPGNKLITNSDLDKDVKLGQLQRVGIEFSPGEVDRIAWTYPLVYPLDFTNREQTEGCGPNAGVKASNCADESKGCPISAALAMFEAISDKGDKTDKNARTHACDEHLSISLTWGLDTSAYGLRQRDADNEESEARHRIAWLRADTGDSDEQMYCTSNDSQLMLLWRAEARAILRPTSRPLCVHQRTIHASQLEHMDSAALRDAFEDRIVMIGTFFDYSNDFVVSPLNDRIPGVFLHATALQDLIAHDGAPETLATWEPHFGMPVARWANLFLLSGLGFLAMMFVVSVRDRLRKLNAARVRHGRRDERWSCKWWRSKAGDAVINVLLFAFTGLLLVCLGVLILVLGAQLHIPFLLVAHVLACVIAAEWLHWSEHLFNWLTESKEN
jgi:CHASE2 domain-containing sensor protein